MDAVSAHGDHTLTEPDLQSGWWRPGVHDSACLRSVCPERDELRYAGTNHTIPGRLSTDVSGGESRTGFQLYLLYAVRTTGLHRRGLVQFARIHHGCGDNANRHGAYQGCAERRSEADRIAWTRPQPESGAVETKTKNEASLQNAPPVRRRNRIADRDFRAAIDQRSGDCAAGFFGNGNRAGRQLPVVVDSLLRGACRTGGGPRAPAPEESKLFRHLRDSRPDAAGADGVFNQSFAGRNDYAVGFEQQILRQRVPERIWRGGVECFLAVEELGLGQ